MIKNLPGTSAAYRTPFTASCPSALLSLDIDHAVFGHDTGQERSQSDYPVLPVRRIEKQYIETQTGRTAARRRILPHPQRTICKRPSPHRANGRLHSSAARTLGACSTITTLDAPRDAASKPRAPLPAKRSRQDRPSQILPEPVEQCFAHPIRRRAQALGIRKAQNAPPPFPTDYAQRVHGSTSSPRTALSMVFA